MSRVYVNAAACSQSDHTQDLVRLGVLADEVGGHIHSQLLQLTKMGQFLFMEFLLGLGRKGKHGGKRKEGQKGRRRGRRGGKEGETRKKGQGRKGEGGVRKEGQGRKGEGGVRK